jgi:hypothetical protein
MTTTSTSSMPPAERARALARAGDTAGAAAVVTALLREVFGLAAEGVAINQDAYSLNSLNGTFRAGGAELFFKFHQEENESAMAGEYYRAQLLADAGLPVDLPLHASTEPGKQILVYRRRNEPRLADALLPLDFAPESAAVAEIVAAQRALDALSMNIYARTLHAITPEQSAAEPIHRLFHERLVDRQRPGIIAGRFQSFYRDKEVRLAGVTLPWAELARLTWVVNGRELTGTLGGLMQEAFDRLEPRKLAYFGGVTAHGDAHNANVWLEGSPGAKKLVLFDPAFAGSHVPSLLAEVKTTFHNGHAHPLWLYQPVAATEQFSANAKVIGDRLHMETDWRPSELRQTLLAAKGELIWRPLLAELRSRGLLPADWARVVHLALFLCPTLVMNLVAPPHTPVTSTIGLATALAIGSTGGDPNLEEAIGG